MKTPLVLTALTIGLLLATGCRRNEAPGAHDEVAVQVVAVASKTIHDEVIASGAIDAVDKADVGFLVAGRILSVDVEDGAEVKRDQVLARLDPSDYQHALEIAEAKLSEVRSRHERLAKLHELGSLTATDFDKIEAGLREASAAAELARRQLAYTELRAPFDGLVVKHHVATGVVVGPGTPIFTVLAPAPVWANVGVSEADARRIAVGQTAKIVLPASGKQAFIGKVEAELPQADPLSRSFAVKIKLANEDHRLRPGNVVISHIQTGEQHSAVTVPPQVVQKFPDGSLFVWIVDPARHTAARQVIEIGSLQTSEIEVTKGLKDGDLVIANVPLTLFEGAQLKVSVTR
ncbi:MAG: efflux RND transporter periplasmic adaptor subunit [Nibricoccus sp.]